MCEFHESTCNGFGDIWWTDNPIYFSSIDTFYRYRGNTLTMCEFHESTCNGFGDIWWTDNPIYFSSIDLVTPIL